MQPPYMDVRKEPCTVKAWSIPARHEKLICKLNTFSVQRNFRYFYVSTQQPMPAS